MYSSCVTPRGKAPKISDIPPPIDKMSVEQRNADLGVHYNIINTLVLQQLQCLPKKRKSSESSEQYNLQEQSKQSKLSKKSDLSEQSNLSDQFEQQMLAYAFLSTLPSPLITDSTSSDLFFPNPMDSTMTLLINCDVSSKDSTGSQTSSRNPSVSSNDEHLSPSKRFNDFFNESPLKKNKC